MSLELVLLLLFIFSTIAQILCLFLTLSLFVRLALVLLPLFFFFCQQTTAGDRDRQRQATLKITKQNKTFYFICTETRDFYLSILCLFGLFFFLAKWTLPIFFFIFFSQQRQMNDLKIHFYGLDTKIFYGFLMEPLLRKEFLLETKFDSFFLSWLHCYVLLIVGGSAPLQNFLFFPLDNFLTTVSFALFYIKHTHTQTRSHNHYFFSPDT